MRQQAINDLDYALSKVGIAKVNGLGWDTAAKTGTWQFGNSASENAHAWTVGFTKKIGAAVWVGAEKGGPIKLKDGRNIFGSQLAGPIWQKFMSNVHKAMTCANGQAPPACWEKKDTKWNQPNFVGDENPPGSVPSPTPPAPQDPGFPNPSVPPGNGGGPGGGGGGGGGGGNRVIAPTESRPPEPQPADRTPSRSRTTRADHDLRVMIGAIHDGAHHDHGDLGVRPDPAWLRIAAPAPGVAARWCP